MHAYGQVQIPGITGPLPPIPGHVTAEEAARQRDETSMTASRNGIIIGAIGGWLIGWFVAKKRR